MEKWKTALHDVLGMEQKTIDSGNLLSPYLYHFLLQLSQCKVVTFFRLLKLPISFLLSRFLRPPQPCAASNRQPDKIAEQQ